MAKKNKQKNGNNKVVPQLRELQDLKTATILKARESWSMLSIMSEFIESTEVLSALDPAVTIFGSARTKKDSPHYKKCVEVARRLSDAGFAVVSGGGPGIMTAANRGAYDGMSPSVGLNISLPNEQRANEWQNISVGYRHFFSRKVALVKYADAFVLFPGGFGTMDELMEVLTLMQTGKTRKAPIVLVGSEFWTGLFEWVKAQILANGYINKDDLNLVKICDEPKEVVKVILDFYETMPVALSEEERLKRLYL